MSFSEARKTARVLYQFSRDFLTNPMVASTKLSALISEAQPSRRSRSIDRCLLNFGVEIRKVENVPNAYYKVYLLVTKSNIWYRRG